MKTPAALIAPLLASACVGTTAQLANEPPKRVYLSEKQRNAVVECLLDRLSDADMRPEKQVLPDRTILSFAGVEGILQKPGLYHFTIIDQASGSQIEARTLKGFVNTGLKTAETCF